MRRLVLVLGCHRAGTSLAARALRCLGVSLGSRAEWYGPDNPAGFWEHQDILAVNINLLNEINYDWHSPTDWRPALTAFMRTSARSARLSYIAHRVLEAELTKTPLFGIKEPRLSRLTPFWMPVIDRLDCDVSIVRVVRNPVNVAMSLKKRNGFPIDLGFALFDAYYHDILTVNPAIPNVTIAYERLMAEPERQIGRISEKLHLDVDDTELQIFLDGAIRPDLWHETNIGCPMPIQTAFTYKVLMDEAG